MDAVRDLVKNSNEWVALLRFDADWRRADPPSRPDPPFSEPEIVWREPVLYIMGVNAGASPEGEKDGPHRPSSKRWRTQCLKVQNAVGASGYISIERCYWGSRNVSALYASVPKQERLREMLSKSAAVNHELFERLPPLIVWAPGFDFLRESIADYDLQCAKHESCKTSRGREERLWSLYWRRGTPFLFTRHPNARSPSGSLAAIRAKLGELAGSPRGP